MSLEFYSNVDMHTYCLMYLNLNMLSFLRVECQFQSSLMLHRMDCWNSTDQKEVWWEGEVWYGQWV